MTRSSEETRAKLLAAAKQLFARGGLHGTSVAQIADEAGVSVGMINHHFGGKDALYRACLAGFGEARLKALDRFLAAPSTQQELALRLEMLVNELLDMHMEEPEVVAILLRDVNASELWGDDVERLLYEFSMKFAQFFVQAKKRGLLRADVDPLVPSSIIYLTLSGLMQVDVHRERVTGKSLKNASQRSLLVKQLIGVVLNGVLAPEASRS